MLSTPATWAEFFEIYCKKKVSSLVMNYPSQRSLTIDVINDGLIYFREGKLFEELHEYPDRVLEDARKGLEDACNIFDVKLKDVQVRFTNLPKAKRVPISSIRIDYLNKFISVEGVVKRVSYNVPCILTAVFECVKCGKLFNVQSSNGKIPKPEPCDCGSKSFRRLPELDVKVDFQQIVIQEFPEGIDRQPQEVHVYLYGELVGKVLPGDKIIVNGILREAIDKNKSRGQFYIEANSIEFLEDDIREINITSEDVKKIKELAKDPNIYDKLVQSIAPNIYGYDDIKLAIALQLFGGCPKELPGMRIRGDIHILLVGDPSTAKSQLLRYVYRIAPRAVFNTGTRSSGVGLTCSVVRDELDGKWTLEAGTLVLADKGIAIIDELEKASRDDKNALLEPLEQQTVTVSKAGINAILNARCALLAAANPKYGRFNKYEPIVDQIDISPPLLSRFDLIFVIFDEPDITRDSLVADAVFRAHTNPVEPAIDPKLLKKYIIYAKEHVKVVYWTKEAWDKIKDFYVSLRTVGKDTGAISITVRQLEAMIRLAEASARVRLSNEVTVEDAERAIRLMKKSLEQFAIDPETGNMDIDYAFTGISAKERDAILEIKEIIKELQNEHSRGAHLERIIEEAEKRGIGQDRVLDIIKKLKERGVVIMTSPGRFRVYEG